MRVIFTCGGTAGHINPALALAKTFQERKPDTEILFVGAAGDTMEGSLVPQAGFELKRVEVNSFRRKVNWAGLKHNAKALRNINRSRRQAQKILRDFCPDLVVGTGGFASYPVTREAAREGIPTAIHESNAVPGLTTKRLAAHVDLVMLGMPGGEEHYPKTAHLAVTGTPVRPEFFRCTRKEAREKLGLTDDRPLVVSFFGSLGASVMNGYVMTMLSKAIDEGAPFRWVHGGGRDYSSILAGLGGKTAEGIEVREYIHDMPLVMAAADLVLCRAGASTISELMALAKPAILVPSPNVTGDHQTKNAQVLERAGAGLLIPEPSCTPEKLYRETKELLKDEARRKRMGSTLATLAPADATQGIYERLLTLVKP